MRNDLLNFYLNLKCIVVVVKVYFLLLLSNNMIKLNQNYPKNICIIFYYVL